MTRLFDFPASPQNQLSILPIFLRTGPINRRDRVTVSASETIVWWCRVSAFETCSVVNDARLILQPTDRARHAALVASQQNAFVLSRLLMEMVVHKTLGESHSVRHPRDAAPCIASQNHLAGSGSFLAPALSITHCKALVVVAASPKGACGVDAETIRHVDDADLTTTLIFNQNDMERAACLRGDQAREHAFQVWTAKEAVLKAHGTGLAVSPLDVFLDGDPRTHAIATLEGDPSRRWHVVRLALAADHVGSLAVPCDGEDRPAWSEHEIHAQDLEAHLSRGLRMHLHDAVGVSRDMKATLA
jgi:phosphopantetheinyl transferase